MSREAWRNVCGCALVFLTYDFLLVGVAADLLLSGENDKEFIAIGAACVVGASAAYAARVGLEDGRWERLIVPVLPALLAGVFAVFGIANEDGIAVGEVTLGFGVTLLAASMIAVPVTIVHLLIKNRRNPVVSGARPSL